MASVAAWRCTAGTSGLGATALWSSSFRDNRLLSTGQVCTSWSGSGYKSHPGLVTQALLDKTAPGSSGQNGRSEPRDPAREPLERLFSQARYEERIAGSKYESEEGLEVAVTELEVDLKSAVDALRNKEEQLRAAEETLIREQSDIENTKSAPKVNSQKNLSYDLPIFDSRKNTPVDLVVVGGGPAGLAVAQRVSSEGLKVLCIDPEPRSVWPNNYGVWVDEFEAMDLLDCLDYTWASAVVHLDDKRRKTLDRPYGRVNRKRLKSKMIEQCISNGVQFYQSKVKHVTHSKDRSFVQCDDGTMVETAVVLDATGHSRRLVQYDKPFNPGYQIAYGIVAEVDEHPFDVDKMLFMDWRDSHLANTALEKGNRKLPTFLYAMPFSSTRIFLEETSLVARPGVPLDVIQKRMELRLKHLGINVKSIEEDEICVIPMGGVLPVIPQRVLGIGGTAGMVHPSTGYMVARTLAAAPILADALVKRLGGCRSPQVSPSPIAAKDSDTGSAQPCAVQHGSPSGDEISAGVWADLWPIERQYQREFFCFGMDVLLRLDLIGTRRFFDSFFSLEPHLWQGFLSSRLYFVELLGFGLSLFAHASNTARAEIVYRGTGPLLNMVKNLALMKR